MLVLKFYEETHLSVKWGDTEEELCKRILPATQMRILVPPAKEIILFTLLDLSKFA